jgi:hypothetical protein
LSKRVSVGHRIQVSCLTDKLSSNKWPMGHFEREMAGDNNRGIQMGDVVAID